MIFITKIEKVDELWLMSGVLADAIAETEFKAGVFTTHLASKTAMKIVCEKPRSVAGIGTTKEGLMVGQFESEQFGVRDFVYRSSTASVVADIAENRILLITSADLGGMNLPAVLTAQPAKLVSVKARIQLAVRRLVDLAEVKAFASRNPNLIRDPQATASIERGMTLPIGIGSGEGASVGVVEIAKQFSPDVVEVVLYFGNQPRNVEPGNKLQRVLTIADPMNPNLRLRFSSELGTINQILG